jgi:hypothetical protein
MWSHPQPNQKLESAFITPTIIKTQTEDAVVLTKAIPDEEDAEDVEEAVEDAVEEETIVTI